MATVTKFTVPVTTTQEAHDVVSWIDQMDMTVEVRKLLRQKHDGTGWAWDIRMDRWFNPEGEKLDTREHFFAYNDATMPAVVSGHCDYSAWDD